MTKAAAMRPAVYAIHAVVLAGLCTGVAHAEVVFTGGGDVNQGAPYYQSYAWSAPTVVSQFTDEDGNTQTFNATQIADGVGTIYSSNTVYSPFSVNQTYSYNGATVTASASTTPGGFFSTRNQASLSVTNAQADNGYYAIGGYGSHTTVQFFSPDALAQRAVFRWHVSGTESPPVPGGCTGTFDNCHTSRLDFLATTNTDLTFNDMFNEANNAYKQYGPGDFSYNISGLPLGQPISLMYWTSAFVQVNPGVLEQGSSFSAFANYSNTYELMGIDLFDSNEALITNWTLTDLASNEVVFNQSGRVSGASPAPSTDVDVPEPGTLALLGMGLAGIGLMRRRRSSRI